MFDITYFYFIQCLDMETLHTIERVNLHKTLGVISHAAHPHFEEDGSMITIGMSIGPLGPRYVVNRIPVNPNDEKTNDSLRISLELGTPRCFTKVQHVASINSRWMLDPGYMHSFSITENYYILIEQPFCINVPKIVKSLVSSEGALVDGMVWHGDSPSLFHIIPKDKSKSWPGKKFTFQSDAFFFLHT